MISKGIWSRIESGVKGIQINFDTNRSEQFSFSENNKRLFLETVVGQKNASSFKQKHSFNKIEYYAVEIHDKSKN
jgi:hypothetical protein